MRQSLTIAGLLLIILGTVIFLQHRNINRPGNHQGYSPEQPIAFSHRVHANNLEISCLYCHSGAEKSRHAAIPAASTCMNCHRFVTAPWNEVQLENRQAKQEGRDPNLIISPEIQKLYHAVGFDPETATYSAEGEGQPIQWIRVHNLPDFVYFDHRRHVTAGVNCQRCHGQIQNMERVEQAQSLSMGWCVNCHRDVDDDKVPGLKQRYASTDCGACHY